MGYHQSLLRPEVPTAVKNHPIISRNSLIFILRYVMANKSDETRERQKHLINLLITSVFAFLSANYYQ